tara:strand:+ start:201 stop:812 length:612 start_codon:yes stop_codon:yes gene_type:complete
VVKTSEDGEILEKAEIFDYAQVQRMIAMRKAREAARLRYEKELRKKRGEVDFAADEDEEKTEKKKKKKKKRKKNVKKKEKSTPGEQESLEAIAKRLAKQEIKDQNHFENEDDSDVFGESTSSDAASRRDGYSDTESDVDEKEAKKEKERHDALLKLHVKKLQKAEKKVVRESVKSKLARLFNRNKGGTADASQHREKKKQSFL